MHSFKPVLDLRAVAAPSAATPGATVYVLLPRLEQLVGKPGFGLRAPICVPGTDAFDAASFFSGPLAWNERLH